MIHVFILTVLVIYLPYVEATVGTPCTGDSDCEVTREACSPLGSCQCNAGYNNSTSTCSNEIMWISTCLESQFSCTSNSYLGPCSTLVLQMSESPCLSGSGLGEPCRNRSECVGEYLMCNSTIGFGTCVCYPNFYEYQGSCYEKHELHDTCYTTDSCRVINSVCSNSTGGICLCQIGYYTVLAGYCIKRSALGGTCHNVDGCIGDHVACDNATGFGVCICSTGYYAHQGFCYKNAGLGGICQNHDGCTGDGVVCSSEYNGTCVCNSSYIPHQENCYHKPDSPKNLLVLNVTSRTLALWLEKPDEVFGQLLGYALKITLAETGKCVIENLIRCTSGCVDPLPNQIVLSTTCTGIIQYQNVSKNVLVMMKYYVNTLDPGTAYWVSVAAVNQYGKGYTADINVTTLHEGDIKVGSNSEPHSMDTIIIVSIVCGSLMVIALTVSGTVIIIKRKRASRSTSATDTGRTYMDLD